MCIRDRCIAISGVFDKQDGSVAGRPDLFYGGNDQVCNFLFGVWCQVRQAIQDIYTCILLDVYKRQG